MLSTLRDRSALILIVSGNDITPSDYVGTEWRAMNAIGAKAAQRAISEHEPHVILIDDLSPSLDGLALCQHIRDTTPNDSVIMVITEHDLPRVEAFIAVGCDDVILPPIVPILLQQRLAQLIRGRRIGQPLTESRMWTKLVFEQNRNASLLIDPATYAIIDANPAACQFYGYTLQELRDKTLRDIALHPPEHIAQNMVSIINRQREYFQFQHRLANGDIRTVEAYASPVTLDGRLLIYASIYDITQRIQAEEIQRRHEALLRQLYDKTPIMMLTIDRQNRIINCNQKWTQMSGYHQEALIGKPLSHILYPQSSAKIEQDILPQLWLGETVHGVECQIRRQDGQLMDALLDGDTLQTPDGEDIGIFVITDISLQKQVEYTLRESEAETRSIFAAMSDTIFIINHEGRIIRIITPETRDTLYRAASQMMGRKLHELFPTHTADQFLAYIEDALRTRQTVHAEYDLIIQGQHYWFNAAISPMDDFRQVVWVTRNVTPFKLAERAAREHEQRYRLLFEHANDIILLVDMRDGRILDANHQAAKSLGYSRDELRRLRIDAIEIAPNGDETREFPPIKDGAQHIIEQTYRRKDGTTFPVETNNRFIQSEDESLMLCFARDITERKAIRQAKQRERVLADVLRDTSAALNQVWELNSVLDAILDNVTRVLPAVTASIMLRQDDQAILTRLWGYEAQGHPLEPLQGHAFHIPSTTSFRTMSQTRQPFIIADTRQDPTWYDIAQIHWIRSYLGAPILLNDEVIGFISLDHSQPNRFSADDAKTLQAFANQAAVAIRNARLFAEVQQYAAELENRVISRTNALSRANQNLKEQIIKRERVEVELKEERNLLRTLINNLPDSIYVKNRANDIILANRNIGRAANAPPLPFDIAASTEDEQALLNGQQSLIRYEITYTDDNGNQVWLEITKVPLRDTHGIISGLIGVIHDISALKRAEAQLLTILSSARCLLWYAIVEEKGEQLSWTFYVSNEDAAQTFLPVQMAPGQSYTQAWLDSRHPDDKERVEITDTNAIRQGRAAYSQEYRCLDANGAVRWLSEDVRVRQLTAGRWSLVGVCTDITARKRAEILLQQTNDELERRVEIRTAELVQANKVLQQEIADRKRAEANLRQRSHELEILRQASISFSSHLELQHLLQAVVEYAMRLVPGHNAHLFLNQDGRPVFGAAAWDSGATPNSAFINPRENGITATVLRSGQRMVINEMREHPLFQNTPWRGSIISTPLLAGERVVGVLNIASGKTRHYHPEELRVLDLLSDQAAISIQNALQLTQIQQEIADRKRAEIAERDQRLLAEALRDAAAAFSETLDLPEVLHSVIDYLSRVIPQHDSDSILLIEDERLARPTYYRRWQDGYWEQIEPSRLTPTPYRNIPNLRRMLETRQPVVISDVDADPDWVTNDYSHWIRSYVGAPILSKGNVIGFINLCAAQPNTFTEEHARRVQSFANQAGVAIQNARLLAEIKHYAAELEERVNERTAQLDHERAQLNAILNAMRDGVIYSDTNRRIRYVNQALIEMTDLPLEQWLSGEAQRHVNTATDDDMKTLWENVLDTLNRQGFWQNETKLKRADGSIFDALLIRTEVTKTSGERIGVVTVVRDISQEKALEEQKRRFIAHAAHELRTPTANLKTRLYLMRRQPEKLSEHLAISEEVVKWMQVLIENLFDMSRFEHGVIVLERGEVILQEIVAAVVTFNEPEARAKNITLEHRLPDLPIRINGDATRLKQVVTNLVTNAIHYTPDGGHIVVSAGRRKHPNGLTYATISVSDNGIGIPAEYLPHLFQPFFRVTEDNKGAGLGLSISRDIVVAHGGDLTVESVVGQGSLFTVWLPLP